MSAAATPTMASLSQTASGNTVPSRFDLANRKDDRKSRPFADEQQVLMSADPEDVAVPIAEPCRGLDRRQVADLFQPDEQLLCAPENDHQFASLQYDIAGGSIASATAAIVTWLCARSCARVQH